MNRRRRLIRIDALQEDRPVRRFESNDELLGAWFTSAPGLSSRPRQKYREQLGKIADAFGPILLTGVKAVDLRLYLDQYMQVCRHFNDWDPAGDLKCMAGANLQTCPVLEDGAQCPKYEMRPKGTVGKHLSAACHLWRWMVQRGYATENVAREVRDQWRAETRHLPSKTGEKRLMSHDEIRRLVRTPTSPNVRFLIVLLAKSGARISELQRMLLDSEHYNPEERWLRIPCQKGAKRCMANDGNANHYLGIDAELAWHLDRYLAWREKRLAKYEQAHDFLLVSHWGKAMNGSSAYKTLQYAWLDPALRAAGINQDGSKGPQRITAHHFRHWFTTSCRENGADPGWVEVMRGCTPPGSQAVYHHLRPEVVVDIWDRWAPRIR